MAFKWRELLGLTPRERKSLRPHEVLQLKRAIEEKAEDCFGLSSMKGTDFEVPITGFVKSILAVIREKQHEEFSKKDFDFYMDIIAATVVFRSIKPHVIQIGFQDPTEELKRGTSPDFIVHARAHLIIEAAFTDAKNPNKFKGFLHEQGIMEADLGVGGDGEVISKINFDSRRYIEDEKNIHVMFLSKMINEKSMSQPDAAAELDYGYRNLKTSVFMNAYVDTMSLFRDMLAQPVASVGGKGRG